VQASAWVDPPQTTPETGKPVSSANSRFAASSASSESSYSPFGIDHAPFRASGKGKNRFRSKHSPSVSSLIYSALVLPNTSPDSTQGRVLVTNRVVSL